MTGRILRIEKTSIHDGGGLRTVVFLQGCPLRCKWCSTPESWDLRGGIEMSAGELISEIVKDEIFYFHSGGGVTLSGGEPLAQAEFCLCVLEECSLRGINSAIETSTFCDYAAIKPLLTHLGTIYTDVKHMDSETHEKLCGVPNGLILDNIRRLAADFRGELIIRVPLIPGINDDDDNLRETARFCEGLGIRRLELLPYHRLGLESYAKLGICYELAGVQVPTQEEMRGRAGVMTTAATPHLDVVIGS